MLFRSGVLRVFVDRPGGIDLDAVAEATTAVSGVLDDIDPVPGGRYTLEVSSPGLERPLVKPADYARFLGMRAKVQLSKAIDAHPNRKVYRGEILAMRETGSGATLGASPEIAFREDDVGEVTLPFDRIAKANLVVDEYKPAPRPGKGAGKPGKHKTKHRGAPRGREATGDVKQHDTSGEKTGRQGE